MADNGTKQAKIAFQTLCAMLDEKDWHYDKDEEKLYIDCGAQGEDLPMQIRISIDPDRQLVLLLSEMPYAIPTERKDALAIAVSAANYGLVDGCFDYGYKEGRILFRITTSFLNSLISKNVFEYMLYTSCYTIDNYNDKFLVVAKTDMSAEEILKFMA